MFDSLSDGFQAAFKSIRGKGKLTEANMQEGLQTVERALLEADVSYPVVQSFMGHITERALGKRVLLSLRPDQELIKIVNDELVELLGPVDDWYAERIGDVVAIARDDWALTSQRIDSMVSGLRGQHGGLTSAEVLIPLRAAGAALGPIG